MLPIDPANSHAWLPEILSDESNLTEWIDYMDLYLTAKDFSGPRLAPLMKAIMKGKYRLWLQAQPQPPTNWVQLKRDLKIDFKPPRDDHRLLAEIAQMQQGKNERPIEFYNRIVAKYSKLETTMPDKTKVKHIINKMLPDFKAYLLPQHPANLMALREKITEMAAWMDPLPTSTDVRATRKTDSVPPTQQDLHPQQTRSASQHSFAKGSSQTRQEQQPSADSATNQEEKKATTASHRTTTKDWIKTQKCYNCMDLGHFARDCTKPRKEDKLLTTLARSEKGIILKLTIKIGSATFSAALDSGSWNNNLSKRWYDLIAADKPLRKYEGPPSVTASGEKIYPLGTVKLDVKTNGRNFVSTFKVFDGLAEDCLLGLDFLMTTKMVVDFENLEGYFKSNPTQIIDLAPGTDRTKPPGLPCWRLASEPDAEPFNVMTQDQFDELQTLLDEHADTFPGKAGRLNIYECKLDFNKDPAPYAAKYRKQSPAMRREMSKMIDELLAEDRIEPSVSEWGSSFFLKRKPDGKFRPILDYRFLNEQLKNDSYPMPRVDEVLDFLAGKHYVSVLDGESGFHQVPLHKDSRDFTTFNCHRGAYRWKVLPFGLKNSSAVFQRVMTKALGPLIGTVCMLYIDDIIVATATWEDHVQALRRIFQALKKVNFTLKRSKCHFCLPTMTILGMTISAKGVHLKGEHTRAVTEFPRPDTRHQLQQFVGLANYFRRFVRDFATKARPLTNLLRKDQPFKWTNDVEESFRTLKYDIVNSDALKLPDYDKPFQVETDASDLGLGAVLTQEHEGKSRVIEFYSKALTPREQKYTTYEKEALAIISAIERWRPYLEGTQFTVVTDCEALKWALSNLTSTGRTARWALKLQSFDFKVVHRAGKLNVVPDALSRNPLPLNFIRNDPTFDIKDKKQLADHQKTDPAIMRIYKVLTDISAAQKAESHSFVMKTLENFELHDDIVYYVDPASTDRGRKYDRLKYYVPKDLRHTFLKDHHDSRKAGHFSVNKVLPSLRRTAYWPKMHADVKKYVHSCHECQMANPAHTIPHGNMQAVIPSRPWAMMGIDFVGKLPRTTNGNQYILVIVDYFTKWVFFIPTRHCTARTAAIQFHRRVIQEFEPPEYLVSDNGPAFIGKVFKQLIELEGITQNHTTAYHPQANATERVNRTLKACLRKFVAENHSSWGEYLPDLETAVRSMPHASTGETPHFLLFGRDRHRALPSLCKVKDLPYESIETYKESHVNRIQKAWDLAAAALQEAARTRKRNYDRRHEDVEFKVNQLVKLKSRTISAAHKAVTKKLANVYFGPFRIMAKTAPNNYNIRNLTDPTDVRKVNVMDIEPYFDPETMTEFDAQQQDDSDQESAQYREDVQSEEGDEGETPAEDSTPGDPRLDETNRTNSDSSSDDDVEEDDIDDDPELQRRQRPIRTTRPPARYRNNWLMTSDSEPQPPLPFSEVEAWLWNSVY